MGVAAPEHVWVAAGFCLETIGGSPVCSGDKEQHGHRTRKPLRGFGQATMPCLSHARGPYSWAPPSSSLLCSLSPPPPGFLPHLLSSLLKSRE